MSTEWQDRRGMFQKGRELHNPSSPTGRRASDTSMTESIARTVSNVSSGVQSPTAAKSPFNKPGSTSSASSSGQRRRSSAASQAGMFGNLTSMKRGSDDYHERRNSIEEMSGRSGGMLSGFWNGTFRGVQSKPATQSGQAHRGVME